VAVNMDFVYVENWRVDNEMRLDFSSYTLYGEVEIFLLSG